MIVFCNANGKVTSVLPSPVYQGSALSGGLYFLAPVPKTNSVTVAFELADGTVTDSYLLTPVIQGLENIVDTIGEMYSVWEWQTKDKRITEQPGVVTAQFSIGHFSGEGENSEFQGQTTAAVTFTVQKGVAPLPTETPRADQWDTLITLYSEVKGSFDKVENIDIDASRAAAAAISAEAYANLAHSEADSAGTSANNAKQSEDNALSYKNAAETASNTATDKAQEASNSATNANTSAFSALDQANRAQSLADSAQTSATTAENAAERAETERSFAYYSIEAETARDYSKGSKIDKIFKDILKRLENLENKSI